MKTAGCLLIGFRGVSFAAFCAASRKSAGIKEFRSICVRDLNVSAFRYRLNDYDYARRNPSELACIIGKAQVLDKTDWKNPILFGAAVFSHPLDDPHLFERLPVRKVLLPGAWMKEMWRPYWDEPIAVWPVGIDTDRWQPREPAEKPFDVLLYDKVRWDHERYEVEPDRAHSRQAAASRQVVREIRYGSYREVEFNAALARMPRHDLPVRARNPRHRLSAGAGRRRAHSGVGPRRLLAGSGLFPRQGEVSARQFGAVLGRALRPNLCGDRRVRRRVVAVLGRVSIGPLTTPRAYILENLTLEKCARQYLRQVQSVSDG